MKQKLLKLLIAVITASSLMCSPFSVYATEQEEYITDMSENQETEDISEIQETTDMSEDQETEDMSEIQETADVSEEQETEDMSEIQETADVSEEQNTGSVVEDEESSDEENLLSDIFDISSETMVGDGLIPEGFDIAEYVHGPTEEAMYADASLVGTCEFNYPETCRNIVVCAKQSGIRIGTRQDDEGEILSNIPFRVPYLFYGETVTVFYYNDNGDIFDSEEFVFSKKRETNTGLFAWERCARIAGLQYSMISLTNGDITEVIGTNGYSTPDLSDYIKLPYGEYTIEACDYESACMLDKKYEFSTTINFTKNSSCDLEYCCNVKDVTPYDEEAGEVRLSYTPSKPYTKVIFDKDMPSEETHICYDKRTIRQSIYSDANAHHVYIEEGDNEETAIVTVDEIIYPSLNNIDMRFLEYSSRNNDFPYDPDFIFCIDANRVSALKEGTDYVTEDIIDAKTQEPVRVFKGLGRYTGERAFPIKAITLTKNNASVTTKEAAYPYTGKGRKPTPIVMHKGYRLKLGQDFTVSYKNNKNVGTATMTITGINRYSGSMSHTFKIRYDISTATATTKYASYVYTGNPRKPAVTVKYNNQVLKEGTDYTLAYKNNKDVGTATIVITGKGKYMNTKELTFKLTPKPITDTSITARTAYASYTYNGKAKQPKPIVKDGSKTLVLDTDYTLSYSNNVKVGTGYVIIKGKGNYKGTLKVAFRIVK